MVPELNRKSILFNASCLKLSDFDELSHAQKGPDSKL